MNKKVILGVTFTLSLVFSGLNSSASAITIEPQDNTVNQPVALDDENEAVVTSDEIPTTNCLGSDSENPENCAEIVSDCTEGYVLSVAGTCVTPEEAETMLEEGTADEPLVVCTDESETDCEATDSDPEEVEADGELEDIEPELWPLIISLSSLGATIIFVIIINLFGRKKS